MSESLPSTAREPAPPVTITEADLLDVLRSSFYPGAREESIRLVVNYCKAAGLDPMQRPVHIVPMKVKQGADYVWRDVIMPGIGLYRTQAARSGQYAGISEPEFGPTKVAKLGNVEIAYPDWCRVIVKRLLGNHIVEFTACEFWLENYATAGSGTDAPNAMWQKRPFAQLAKCTEAQALRKAFPELGSQPTIEEMQGKPLEDEYVIDRETGELGKVTLPQRKSQPKRSESSAPSQPEARSATPESEIGEPRVAPASEAQRRMMFGKLKALGGEPEDFAKAFGKPIEDVLAQEVNAALELIAKHWGK